MSNLAVGVIASIIATVIIAIVVKSFKTFKKHKINFSGEWDQVIPPYDGEPAKKDLVKCRQTGNRIYGVIYRIEPSGENWKSWKFDGRIHENVFAACFWSIDPSQHSFGSWFLVHSGAHIYDGYYIKLRPTERNLDYIVDQRAQIPFKWIKRITR